MCAFVVGIGVFPTKCLYVHNHMVVAVGRRLIHMRTIDVHVYGVLLPSTFIQIDDGPEKNARSFGGIWKVFVH